MKLAIIIVVLWYLILQLWVRNAEQKSKAREEMRKRELLKKIREREEWVKRYSR
jgi:hypothetical protein